MTPGEREGEREREREETRQPRPTPLTRQLIRYWRMLAVLLLLPAVATVSAYVGTRSKPMRLVISPSVATIQRPVGADLDLICTVSGADEEEVGLLWTKNKGIDRTGNARVHKLDNRSLALHITKATVADSGFYQCSASGAAGFVKSNVDVFFMNELRFVDMNSHIDDILATASFNISCRVDQSEGEVIRTVWTKYGEPLPANPDKFAFYLGGAILQIKSYNPVEDAGEYVCRVENLNTGSSIKQMFAVGGLQNSRRANCNNYCSKFCSTLYPFNY